MRIIKISLSFLIVFLSFFLCPFTYSQTPVSNQYGIIFEKTRIKKNLTHKFTEYEMIERAGKRYLIDKKGNEYKFTNNINELDETIEAFTLDRKTGFEADDVRQKIFENRQLKILFLESSNIKKLPVEIGQLSNLQYLSLRKNQLTAFPVEIGQLSNLQSLHLSSNELTSLPSEIGQLSNLQSLDLRYNQLTSLPTEIGQLSNLQSLSLSSNELRELPSAIGQLSNLQSLYLYGNELRELPSAIGQLSNLQSLYLRANNFSKEEKQKIKKLLPNCNIRF